MKLLAVFIWKWLMFWINRKQTVKMVWDCLLGAFLLLCLFKGSSYWDIVKWTIKPKLYISLWLKETWRNQFGSFENNLVETVCVPVLSHQQIGTVVMPIILLWIWLLSVDSQMDRSEIDSIVNYALECTWPP